MLQLKFSRNLYFRSRWSILRKRLGNLIRLAAWCATVSVLRMVRIDMYHLLLHHHHRLCRIQFRGEFVGNVTNSLLKSRRLSLRIQSLRGMGRIFGLDHIWFREALSWCLCWPREGPRSVLLAFPRLMLQSIRRLVSGRTTAFSISMICAVRWIGSRKHLRWEYWMGSERTSFFN